MAEELIIANSTNKEERYKILIPQIQALVGGEPELIASLSNVAAALKVAAECRKGELVGTVCPDTGLKYLSTGLFP